MNQLARQEIHNILVKIGVSAASISYWNEVQQIEDILHKNWYVPEHGNLLEANKAKVPAYSEDSVRQVGRRKIQFTPEQKAAAREILRELGMI